MSLFEISDRLKKLPPYLFSKIDQIKQQEIQKGRKLFSLGIGDPDLPTPTFVIERLIESAKNPQNHQYPSYTGMLQFRKAVATWYSGRFGISLDPEKEVLTLIGSKEGIAHIPLSFVNPGQGVLVPDPGYPVYEAATVFAGGLPLKFPLLEKNSYLPKFSELEELIKNANTKVRLIFLNYPNNPTAALSNTEFFSDLVKFALKHEIFVCHDNAYSEIYFDGKKPLSFLQIPGAKEIGCEFHSLSKTFNMTGWRVGFLVGNSHILSGLSKFKTNIDSGVFNACQEAGISALENSEPFCSNLRTIYERRRNILIPALSKIGLKCDSPQATFYAWAKIPTHENLQIANSEKFVLDLIMNKGIVATPGVGFGTVGEGYVRFTLCSNEETLKHIVQLLQAPI